MMTWHVHTFDRIYGLRFSRALTAHSRAEAFALVPLGAKLVALTSEFTVWAHAGIEYHLPRRCIRAVVGSYRNATLKIGEML